MEGNEYLSADELTELIGYKGITQRISELRDIYGYKIEKVRVNGNLKYHLHSEETIDEEEEEEDDKYSDISYEVSKRNIKDTQEAITKYYDTIRKVRKEVKETKPREITLKRNNESIIILNSDWHIGKKVTNEYGKEVYNTEIARKNLEKYYHNLRKLIGHIVNSVTIDEIVIANIGDLVDGETIYEGQFDNLDEYLDRQIEIATREKYKQVSILQDDFGVPIREEYVVGNHGRPHGNFQGMTNFDSLVHLNEQIISDITNNKDLTVCKHHQLKDRVIDVRGHNILMRHWAPSQTETPAAFRRYGGWLNIYNYDAMLTAHYHSPKLSYFQRRPIIRNGCIFGDDDFARELGYTADPCQVVLGVSDKRLPTFLYTLDMIV